VRLIRAVMLTCIVVIAVRWLIGGGKPKPK
jgi:hypothetical protein